MNEFKIGDIVKLSPAGLKFCRQSPSTHPWSSWGHNIRGMVANIYSAIQVIVAVDGYSVSHWWHIDKWEHAETANPYQHVADMLS